MRVYFEPFRPRSPRGCGPAVISFVAAAVLAALPMIAAAGTPERTATCPGSSLIPASAGASLGLDQAALWQWVAARTGVDPAAGPPPVCTAPAGDLALIRGQAAGALDLVAIYQPEAGLVLSPPRSIRSCRWAPRC